MYAAKTILHKRSFPTAIQGFIKKFHKPDVLSLASTSGKFHHRCIALPISVYRNGACSRTYSSWLFKEGATEGRWLKDASIRPYVGFLPALRSARTHNRAFSSEAAGSPSPENPEKNALTDLSSPITDNGDNATTSWIDSLDRVRHSTVDAGTAVVNKVGEWSDAIHPHVQNLYKTYPSLESAIVPLSTTLLGTVMAWSLLPLILKRFHKYTSDGPINTLLLGNSAKKQIPYDKSVWSALEDPAKYLVTFMAFSQLGALLTPSISTYLPHAWRGATVLSFVWFLQRWKTYFFSRAMTGTPLGIEQDKLSALDKTSSLGLVLLAMIASAEILGVPIQSILTVGGVGGVAAAFAARDVLGNILTGFSMQVTKPFSRGDLIKAGSIEGQVVDVGLTSTSLLSPESFLVIVPNSLFQSQAIVNRSRAKWHSLVTKIVIKPDNVEKVTAISTDIREMLLSNAKVVSDEDLTYCYLTHLESSYGELAIVCNLKKMRKSERFAAEQEILLAAAGIIKQHGVELGSTLK